MSRARECPLFQASVLDQASNNATLLKESLHIRHSVRTDKQTRVSQFQTVEDQSWPTSLQWSAPPMPHHARKPMMKQYMITLYDT